MKRFVVTAVLLLFCLAAPTAVRAADKKELAVDMSGKEHIFVGWVGMDPDQFAVLGYSRKSEWTELIQNLNSFFIAELKTEYLPGKTLTAAKNKDDVDASGNDLYIKFTNVTVDEKYRLHLAIHFIDPRTNAEIALIPLDRYTGRVCGLEGCLQKSLKKIGERVRKQIATGKS